MATASSVMSIVADRTGIPFGHVRVIARRLIESGCWPAGNGATIPQLELSHVVLLLLALASDCRASDSPRIAADYYDLPCIVDGVTKSAGEYIEDLLAAFNKFDLDNPEPAQLAYQNQIEVCCTVPAVRASMICTDGTLEFNFGANDKPWQNYFIRHSVTIPGAVLFKIATDIAAPKRVARIGTVNGQSTG